MNGTPVIIHLFKPFEHTTPRRQLKVNHELQVIMICYCRFILDFKKSTIQVSDVDNEGAGAIWKISAPSFQFYCKCKTTLKK